VAGSLATPVPRAGRRWRHASPATHNLAVAGIAAALAGKPALLGYISGRKAAWGRFMLQNGGQYLFVSGNGSDQIQVVNLRACPDS
jgi:hypothetical protein